MHKLIIAILVAVTVPVILLGGCRSLEGVRQESAPHASQRVVGGNWPRAFTGDLGKTVTFQSPPQRLVSLSPNLTEIVFLVGAGEQLAGRTDFCDYPPEASAKPSIGGIINPSLEKLVSLQPDLVLAARGVDMAFLDRLEEMAIPVLGYDPQTLDEVIALVRRVGRLTGHGEAGMAAASRLTRRKARIVKVGSNIADKKLRVLFVLSREPLFVAGVTSFVDDMLKTCGARNAIVGLPHVDQNKPWPRVSREAIVAADPQLIIFAQVHGAGAADTPADILVQLSNMPAWREVAAVRDKQVYTIADDIVTIPGPRLIDGLEQIWRLVKTATSDYQD